MVEFIEAFGAILSVGGTVLLALNNKYSRWGWLCYLMANISLVHYTYMQNAQWLLGMYIVFTVISVVGIARWFGFPYRSSSVIGKPFY